MQKYSDSEKLEQLYVLYEQKMYAVAFSNLYNEQQTEDVVQETFIKLLKNIRKIKEPSDTRTREDRTGSSVVAFVDKLS